MQTPELRHSHSFVWNVGQSLERPHLQVHWLLCHITLHSALYMKNILELFVLYMKNILELYVLYMKNIKEITLK